MRQNSRECVGMEEVWVVCGWLLIWLMALSVTMLSQYVHVKDLTHNTYIYDGTIDYNVVINEVQNICAVSYYPL